MIPKDVFSSITKLYPITCDVNAIGKVICAEAGGWIQIVCYPSCTFVRYNHSLTNEPARYLFTRNEDISVLRHILADSGWNLISTDDGGPVGTMSEYYRWGSI